MRLSLRATGPDAIALLRDLYHRHSQQYQKWLTPDQFAARFAPTAQQSAAVQSFLRSQGLTVTAVNRHNYTVTAQGRVADMQRAFGVQINRYNFRGDLRYSNSTNPSLPIQLGTSVSSIGGLHDVRMKPHHVVPVDGGVLIWPDVREDRASSTGNTSATAVPNRTAFRPTV